MFRRDIKPSAQDPQRIPDASSRGGYLERITRRLQSMGNTRPAEADKGRKSSPGGIGYSPQQKDCLLGRADHQETVSWKMWTII